MTAAHHASPLLSSRSPNTNEPSQMSTTDYSNHSKASGTSPSLNDSVSSVVNDIVDTAVSTATLDEERRNVQTLINKLVSRVREDAINEGKDPTVGNEKAKAPERKQLFSGVPLGDHRLRKCPRLPVTWTQTMDSVTLNVDVPPWVRKQQVSVKFTSGSVKASVTDGSPSSSALVIDEPFVAEITVDGCMWALEEEGTYRKLIIEIEKTRVQWWARLFMSDDPAEYSVVMPQNAPRLACASDTDIPEPDDKETSGNSLTESTSECSALRRKEQRVGKTKGSSPNLHEDVASFVDDVINAAISRREDTVKQPRPKPAAREGMNQQQPDIRPQKVLTRADIPKMVEQYKKIVAKGGPGASQSALQLATFYHHGIGVEQNDLEAARLYKYALENGILDPSAAFQLGLIYNQGAPGLEPDAAEAVRWWRVSASLRNPVAMFNLGVMYMNGSGCDMDPIMATRWFQQAQALDPRLQPPQFSRAQLEERIVAAMKLKKQRMRRALPPEEKQRRKELALQKVRVLAYGSAAIVGLGVSMVALRYWWRNRL